MTKRRVPLATLSTAVLLLSACGGGDDTGATRAGRAPPNPPASSGATSPSPTAPQRALTPTLTIEGFAFGAPLSVQPGQRIRVVNEDSAPHTVTAANRAFDLRIPGGATSEFTAPRSPGSYPFLCTIHPTMKGTLTVSG